MTPIEDVLRQHPFFEGLAPAHLQLLAGCAKNVLLPAGAYVMREGDPADTFHALRDGAVALEVHAPGGPLVVQTLHGGDVLGWSWLFPPHRCAFDARIVEPTRALALDGVCLREKAERDHELGYALMKRVAKVFTSRLAATRLQLLDLYGHAAR
ncbi:MAG: cyclic nucleotide-binding domain-containing protein [Planctomycetes bacterium]|nr:cyclic nucleotide-binding domain-containing protein [Planctomycetota bacterium]